MCEGCGWLTAADSACESSASYGMLAAVSVRGGSDRRSCGYDWPSSRRTLDREVGNHHRSSLWSNEKCLVACEWNERGLAAGLTIGHKVLSAKAHFAKQVTNAFVAFLLSIPSIIHHTPLIAHDAHFLFLLFIALPAIAKASFSHPHTTSDSVAIFHGPSSAKILPRWIKIHAAGLSSPWPEWRC